SICQITYGYSRRFWQQWKDEGDGLVTRKENHDFSTEPPLRLNNTPLVYDSHQSRTSAESVAHGFARRRSPGEFSPEDSARIGDNQTPDTPASEQGRRSMKRTPRFLQKGVRVHRER
ncbi:hypothetical protein NPIL_268571, partial [Nephila pilipes]